WRDAAEVGECGDSMVGFVPRHGPSSAIGAASRTTKVVRQSGSMARNSPVQVVPDVCTPLFSVLGTPPKPLGMITHRVGDGVRRFNACLLPRERSDGLHGCNGRLLCLVIVGTGLAPLMVGKASPFVV